MASRFRNILRLPCLTFQKKFNVIRILPVKQNLLSFATYSNGRSSGVRTFFSKAALIAGAVGISSGVYTYMAAPDRNNRMGNSVLTEMPDSTINYSIPDIKPSREVFGPASHLELDLILYQYQTCPFCCKVRAFLDFYGIPYKVVEVNPVMRQQIKFSKYKKVPILIAKERGADVQHQLNDSSVIISIMGSLVLNTSGGLQNLLQYYVPYKSKGDDGKEIEEVLNKYNIMYGEKIPKGITDETIVKEKWGRKWADNELVHILSPNIYRTYDEALQAFNYFSEVGEWEKNFSTMERLVVIYVGATAMYFVGKMLKKRHRLKEDVRESLYDACKLWMKEIDSKKKFSGGDVPNLADLAVYGLLSSIEGCLAFQDLLKHTHIGPWYHNMKEVVSNHRGYHLI